MLWRTLNECRQARWLKLTEISPDIHKAEITGAGRMKLRQPR